MIVWREENGAADIEQAEANCFRLSGFEDISYC